MIDYLKDNMPVIFFLGFILSAVFVPALAFSGCTGYHYYREVTCSSCSDGTPFLVNGTGFNIGGDTNLLWTKWNTTNVPWLIYNSYSNYTLVYNDTCADYPQENETGYGADNLVTSIWATYPGVYHLKEGTGTTTKDSTNNRNGTFIGTGISWTTSGKYGNAIDIDGATKGYVNVSNWKPTSAFSWGGWFRREGDHGSTYAGLISEIDTLGGSGWTLQGLLGSSNATAAQCILCLVGGTYPATQAYDLPLNTWVRIDCVADNKGANKLYMYVNGVLYSEVATANADVSYTGTMEGIHIGHRIDATATDRFNGKIDEVHLYNGLWSADWINKTYQEGIKTLGNEQGAVSSIVTISYPIDSSDYYLTSITPQYTATSFSNSTFNCSLYYDGNTTAYETISTTNATLTTGSAWNAEHGSHSLNVTCTDGSGDFDDIVYFTTYDYGVTSETYDSEQYETNSTTFTLQVNTSSRVDYINASLYYNSGYYDADPCTQTGTVWDCDYTLNVPLQQTNNTNLTFNWDYNVTYTNTTVYELSNTAHNQTVYYSFWVSAFSCSTSAILEGDTFTCSGTVNKVLDNGSFAGVTEWDSTNSTATVTEYTTYASIYDSLTAPEVATPTDYNATTYINVTYDGDTRLMSYMPHTVTVSNMNLTTGVCTPLTLEFISRWEANNTSGPAVTLEAYFITYNGGVSKTFNFTLGPSTNNTVCISPAYGSFTADMQALYYNTTSYTTRPYYFQNITLSNSTQTVYLYTILDDDNVNDITFTVLDISSIAVPNVLLQVNRWFTGAGEYRLVAVGQSDANGKIIIPLRNTASDYYQFILVQDNEVLNTYSQYQITETEPNNLYTSSTDYLNYFDYVGNVAYSCTNVTAGSDITIACTVSNTDNTVNYYTLSIEKVFAITNSTACTNTLDAASGTLTCDILNYTSGYYVWTLKANFEGVVTTPDIVLDTGYFGQPSSLMFDSNVLGLFVTFILILAVAGTAKFMTGSNALAVIGSVVGIIVAVGFGIFDIGSNIPMVSGMLILALIVASMVGE